MKSLVRLAKKEKFGDKTFIDFVKGNDGYQIVLKNYDIIMIKKNGYEYNTLKGELNNFYYITSQFLQDKNIFEFNEGNFENIDLVYKVLSDKLCVSMDKIYLTEYKASKEKTLISINFECFVVYNDITTIDYKGEIIFTNTHSDEIFDTFICEKRF